MSAALKENCVQIAGEVHFLGWFQPTWDFRQPDGSMIALKAPFWEFAASIKGELVTQDYAGGKAARYTLHRDPASPFEFRYEIAGNGAGIFMREGFGFSNVTAYLEMLLTAMNGRWVKAEITPDRFQIEADPDDGAFEVRYFGSGNSARVPEGAATTVCGIGRGADACAFLTAGSAGFSCEKFSGFMARLIMDRVAGGEMKARRLGGCACVGREEEAANG